MTESTPTTLITDHQQLDEAMRDMEENWAKIPVVDQTGTCLDYVLVPISPSHAHEMLREAQAHDVYNMCLRATRQEDIILHLEIVNAGSAP